MGVGRAALVALVDGYREEEVGKQERVVLGLHPRLAPIKAAVFPLMKKHGQPELAQSLLKALRGARIPAAYDQAGSIGRRYRRQDEAGTPWCVTIDGRTSDDQSVTIRDRDSLEQVRVGLDHVVDWIRERL